MTTLREAAQQALEALEWHYHQGHSNTLGGLRLKIDEKALRNLRAALAQQDESDAYGYASYLAVAIWEKYYKDTAPDWKPLDDLVGVLTQIDNMTSGLTRLAQHAEPQGCATEEDCTKQPWCRIRGECQRKQAEPLNLRDPAVQKRLAAQWGYVPAAQAEPVEPVEPVAWMVYTEGGTSAYVTDNPTDLVGAYRALSLYTAPPQRTMVPLTEEEILAAVGWERAAMYMKLTPSFPVDEAKKETLTNARAIEKASWKKNHG